MSGVAGDQGSWTSTLGQLVRAVWARRLQDCGRHARWGQGVAFAGAKMISPKYRSRNASC